MIEIEGLEFAYPAGGFRLRVASLRVSPGETAAIVGPSGCGKTTLLHLVAGILLPREGILRVDGFEPAREPDAARRRFRITRMGLVFQEFELLEYLSARENILLPYRVNPALRLDAAVRASAGALADRLGIGPLLDRPPRRLSQGERQRVAIARALVARPRLVLADEPTGNLDPATGRAIVEVILERARESGAGVLAVTHDPALLDRFDRVIDLGRAA